MNLVAVEVTFLTTYIWIAYLSYGHRSLEHQINVGFIWDCDANTIKRAMAIAEALADNSSSKVRMKIFQRETKISNCYNLSTVVCSLLRETVYTIIGAADVTSYDVLEAYSQAMHIPIILYNGVRKPPKTNYTYLLHIVPSYMNAIVDYLKFYKWKIVFYLHDKNDPLWAWKVSEFFSLVSENDLHIIQRSLDFPSLSYEQLRYLDHIDLSKEQMDKVFVVDITDKSLQLFFTQIMQLGMNRKGYHYIIGGLEITSVEMNNLIHGGSRITGFQLPVNKEAQLKLSLSWNKTKSRNDRSPRPLSMRELLFFDTVCFLQHSLEVIHKQSDSIFRTRGKGLHWNTNRTKEVICHKNCYLEKGAIIIKYLKRTHASCLTGTIEFDERGRRKNFALEVYSMSRNPLHKIGNWYSERGYVELNPIKHRGDTPQDPYIVTLVLEPPFVINDTDKQGSEIFEGYCIDMFNKIANSSNLKLNYVIRKRNDTKYGNIVNQETNEWDGMISELIKGEADIALGSITITEKRQEVVDFTKPFMNTGISIMIKRPDKQKPNVFSFKEPFSNSMWACIMCGFAGVSLVLVLIGRFSPYEWHNNSDEGPSEDFSVLNSLWSSFGALLQQGSDYLPSSVSGRIAECAWWFFTLIIVSSYTANLAAFLTVEKLNIPIDSADALSRQTKIKYGFKEGGATNEFFKNTIVPTYKKMYQFVERTVPSPNVPGNREGWEKVKDGKGEYAFLLESTSNEYYNQQKPCKTMKVGDDLNQNGYGIATRKGSSLSRQLNLALLRLIEKGELINLKQRWWYDKGQCGQSVESKGKQSLSLSNVAGTFHIVILGLVIAMIFSALEFLYHYRKRNKSKKKVIQTVLITDIDKDIEESQPLKATVNGAQDNQGYQTTMNSPANLIMFESMTENGSTML